MKSAVVAVAGAMVLAGYQGFVLDRQPERLEEERISRLSELPAGSLLPSYISYLFLGSFRAVAIDTLWIQLRDAEEEKRYYRVKEILELIAVLQPRNEEVWSLLGWHLMFNVPATVARERRWQWEKEGIRIYYKGHRNNPASPYMKFEIAFKLWKRALPVEPDFYNDFIRNVETDPEVQQMMLDGRKSERPLSPFELAILWMERAIQDLPEGRAHTTQMGMNLHRDYCNNFLRDFMVAQAMLCKSRGDLDGAKAWLQKALDHTNARLPDEGINRKYRELFRHWREALDLERSPETERQCLERYHELLRTYGSLDNRFIYKAAGAIKRRLGGDALEYNDRELDAVPVMDGRDHRCTIFPDGDIDWFFLYLPEQEHARVSGGQATVSFLFEGDPAVRLQFFLPDHLSGEGLRAIHPYGQEISPKPFAVTVEPGRAYYIKIWSAAQDGAPKQYRLKCDAPKQE